MTFRDLVGHRTTLGLMARALDAGFLLHIVSFAVGSYALARVRSPPICAS